MNEDRRRQRSPYYGDDRRRFAADVAEEDPREDEAPPRQVSPIPVDVQSLPTWLRAAVFLGVPSVIALYLVYALTVQMSRQITAIASLQQLQSQSLQMLAGMAQSRQGDANNVRAHFDDVTDRLERLILNTCVVASQTPEERARCIAP